MPRMRRCADRMCRALVPPNEQYCKQHQQQSQRSNQQLTTQQQLRQRGANQAYNQYDRERDSFYQSKQWQSMRNLIVTRDMNTCQVCGNVTEDRKLVDHLVAYKIDQAKALDPSNLWTLCYRCHSAKTVVIEGQLLSSPNGINKARHASKQWYQRAIRQLNNRQ